MNKIFFGPIDAVLTTVSANFGGEGGCPRG